MESSADTMTPESRRTFALRLDVPDSDIDLLGHASNIAYVRWVQEVAVAHSDAVGLDFAAYQHLGAVFVVRRHEIDYLRPVLRTDVLELRTWIDSAFAAKCKRATSIVKLADASRAAASAGGAGGAAGAGVGEVEVARAMTTWGFIELATGRPTRIPDGVRTAFGWPARASVAE